MLNLVKKYLRKSNYLNSGAEFEEAFLSHPNYPSLFALTDSLTLMSIENVAIKIPKEQFVELPDVFLAIYNDELVLVSKQKTLVSIENEKGKKQKLSTNEFLFRWNQVVVAVEPNLTINNVYSNSNYKWLSFMLPSALLILLSLFSNKYSITDFLLLGTSVLGLVLSILILQEKFGVKTEFSSKFCNITPQVSCDSVIKSEAGKIFNWLSFSDLPLLFFGANLFSILIDPGQTGGIISRLSLISVPFLGYSIWIQKVKIKKWCLLCLMVLLLIVFQGFIALLTPVPFKINYAIGFTYLFPSILVFSGWLLLKPLLEKKIKTNEEVNVLRRFKRNFKVYQSFAKEVEILDGLENLKGIRFGNVNAPIQIALFLSPGCGHCHKTFKDAHDFFMKFPDRVYVNVLFNVNPENKENPYGTIIETLLTINSYDAGKAKEALVDWHIHNLSMELWKEKWKVSAFNMFAGNEMHKQYDWCLKNQFNYTPVKIVNTKLLPKEYEISDLKYFMNDFEGEKLSEINAKLA